MKPVDDSLPSIETLETEHKKLQQLYEQVKNKLSEYEMEQFDFDRASKEIESKIEVYKKDNIEEKYYELEKLR